MSVTTATSIVSRLGLSLLHASISSQFYLDVLQAASTPSPYPPGRLGRIVEPGYEYEGKKGFVEGRLHE